MSTFNHNDKFFITSGGDVGIGVSLTNPAELLTLNKASGAVGILLEGDGTDVGKFKVASAGVNHAVQFGTISNNEIQFHTANTEKMRITGGGEVYFDAAGTTAAAIKDGAFLYRNDSNSYLQFVTGTNNDTTSLYLYRKNSADNDVQIFGKIGNCGLGLTIGSGGNNNTLILDANENATFAGTIKPSQGMESTVGVYTDGGTYTNQWQKVLSIPYASNMFGYAGIVLSIMQIGATNGAGAHADIHIHYKFQSNNGRLNANIINYGETKIEDDHIAIRRDHSNLRIELYHKVTTSYTSPRYLLKHNTTTITWYNTVTGDDTALGNTTDDGFTELNITNGFTSNVANGNVTLEGDVEIYKEGNDTTGKLTLAGNNNTGTPGQKTSATIEHRGAHLKTVITHNGSDVITIGTGTDTVFAGNITAGNSSTAATIRAYHSDGAYVDHTGYGIEFARNTSYLRPNNDGARTMYFGYDERTWNAINFDSNSYSFQRNGSEYMQINSSGDVGIGTAPETAGPTWRTLFVGSSLSFISRQSASGYDSLVANNYYVNSSNVDKKRVTGTSSRMFLDGDVIRFQNSASAAADSTVTWSERMRISADGNVGIGSESPGRKLTVTGDASGDANNLLIVNENDTDGDSASIGFSMLSNDTYVKAGIFFKRTTDQGRGDLIFATNNEVNGNNVTLSDARMTIDRAGNVGIGTTSPTAHNSGKVLHIHNPSGNSAELHLTDNTSGSASTDGSVIHHNASHLYIQNHENGDTRFYNNGSERMRLEADADLHVDGDVIAYSTTISDKALKDDVVTIDSALDKVSKLRGVEYTWNATSRKGQKDIGVIAQEVEEVIPEIVREKEMALIDGGKYKTVDYEKLTAVLIQAVKELKQEVEQLKNKCNDCTC